MRLFLIFLSITTASVYYSTEDYCTICSAGSHIMCKYKKGPSSVCQNYKKSEINEKAIASIVDIHNQLRAKVANGLELRGNPGPQPPASNILTLNWDYELAEIAQRIADQCFNRKEQFVDDCRLTDRFSYGIMIASLVHNKYVPLDFVFVFNYWYNHVQLFNASQTRKFEVSLNRTLNGFSYYTQIVWAETRFIGCGHAAFEEANNENNKNVHFIHRLVCNYAPAGNIIDAIVYKAGEPCSLCPEGYGCSADYPGLCTNASTSPIVIKNDFINQVEIDFSKERSNVPTSNNNTIAASKRHHRRLYNEGDKCYCGFIMRTENSGRSLTLNGIVVLSIFLTVIFV